MKKIIVGVLCSGMLFTGLIGSNQASASEVNNNINDTSNSEIVLKANVSPQARGTVNGIRYKFAVRTGRNYPPRSMRGCVLVYVKRLSSTYVGYYR